jgi:hypothetical protein
MKRGKGISIHAISRIEKAVINIALVYFQRIKLHLIAGRMNGRVGTAMPGKALTIDPTGVFM